MNRIIALAAVFSLALPASFAVAQMQQGDMRGGPDRAQMHERMKAIQEACKDKPDRRACMTEQYCAKSPDPAKCQARAKEHGQRMQKHAEERQKMHEACNGKRGDDLANCIKAQRQMKHAQRLEMRQKAHEACNGKRGDELSTCLRDQREKLGLGHHRRG